MLVKVAVSIHALESFPFRGKVLNVISIERQWSCLPWAYEVVLAWVMKLNATLSLLETPLSILRKKKWRDKQAAYQQTVSNIKYLNLGSVAGDITTNQPT